MEEVKSQKPISCQEAMLLAFSKLSTPVIIGSSKLESITKGESRTAQELAKAADCEGCIGCNLKKPGQMEPMTEAYNTAVSSGELEQQKEKLASRLPEEKVVIDNPEIAA
ncbi:MAG: hypothetical protein H6799_00885 [Candidatus Nomurabacteria bacterium]|nr:MAG: hypothetical protein H6799_00885 [Candidatus Nomurabacteria bacterium]HRV75868.1 hypothetical protein [Candidatus Saccharimonadales bacterium]